MKENAFRIGDIIRYKGYLYRITKKTYKVSISSEPTFFYDVEAIYPYDPDGVVQSIGPGGIQDVKLASLKTVFDFEEKVREVANLYHTEGISDRTIKEKAKELLELADLLIKQGNV